MKPLRTSLDRGMGHAPRVVAAAKRAILDLGARANDSISFRVELQGVLAKLLVLDAFCVNTSDPATLLITGSVATASRPTVRLGSSRSNTWSPTTPS